MVSHVGMGSIRQDLSGEPLIKPAISSRDAMVKSFNCENISRHPAHTACSFAINMEVRQFNSAIYLENININPPPWFPPIISLSLSLSVSIYLSIYIYLYLSISLSLSISIAISISIYVYIYIYFYLSIYLSLYIYIYINIINSVWHTLEVLFFCLQAQCYWQF